MTTFLVPAAPVSPLRQRLIDEMDLRRFPRETQRNYFRDIGRLATFLGRSPDTETADDLCWFQIVQQEAGLGVPTINAVVSALRFFFVHTIDRPDLARKLVRLHHPRQLPDVLSPDEVRRLLGATVCLKHLAALSVAYGAGLRVAEVAALKVADVDSTRMILRIEHGKGGRDRNAMLSADLLALLRQWWIEGHRQGVLHRDGCCSPARPGHGRSRPGSFTASWWTRLERRRFPKGSVPIRYAIPSPPTFWKTASTSASSRFCWGTPSSIRPRSTPRSPHACCEPWSAPSTGLPCSTAKDLHPAEAMRASIEVADIFRAAGPLYGAAKAGHLSLAELKIMSAVEHCRTAALGGHVEGCDNCAHLRVSYNSCRNRHCPRCQGAAARDWLAEREADLLPVGYFHVVFTLPSEIAALAFQNKAAIYSLLFRAAAETMTRITADPRHLGACIGFTAVLHTWGSAMTHHPHVHMIVPGGGLLPDGTRRISARPAFLLPVQVLSALFRRLFLDGLSALHDAGSLAFVGTLAHLAEPRAFARHLAPVRRKRWMVYAKPPFAGPRTVLAYLSRYTHRVAISSRRILAFDGASVTFREGLPPGRRCPPSHSDARGQRVHPSLPSSRPAKGIPPHPAVRVPDRPGPQGQPRSHPQAPRCSVPDATTR
ncbi:Phage integrase, N-terminal SAM-like domain [Consotaella salsifontis]|uniref:Phage integrase, N-terminal SAM-like domain n=1 Tax=Consotaella salsifontis TaxID=1365950 RepID=A0A1T4NHA6_9HYPH|nr:Phage integrase, N-terminal SAM-like domain [Consotaella salsifontis]